jgi:hypothetical protein
LLAGATSKFSTDPAKAEILAEGTLLKGTDEQEPTANTIRRRLSQKYPYQCSGSWIPVRVERVMENVQASVNGKIIKGPSYKRLYK